MAFVESLLFLASWISASVGRAEVLGAAAMETDAGNVAGVDADAGKAPARQDAAKASVLAATPSVWRVAISFLTKFMDDRERSNRDFLRRKGHE